MLKQYLPREHMQTVDSVESWEEAIELAARPLLEKEVIEPVYISNMIQSVHDNGPYIVLNDYFALPHAKAGEGVNKVGLALLTVEEPVDLEGNPVKIFLVLAAVDSTAHLEALSEISELLMDEEAYEVFLSGKLDEIEKIIEGGERE